MSQPHRVLGIDPGVGGAYAVVEERDGKDIVVACDVLPTAETLQGKDQVDQLALQEALRRHAPYCLAAVEQVGTRPGEGPVGAFTFGRVVGRIETVLVLNGWAAITPTPQVWKRVILTGGGVTLAGDRQGQKRQAIEYVKGRFPGLDLKKSSKSKVDHDGKAEAVCLALYALTYLRRRGDAVPMFNNPRP